jgi:GNAT superfamily N-acetyltransferase
VNVHVSVVDEQLTRELRRSVLRPNRTPDTPLPGDELTDAVHLAAIGGDGAVLGTCFVYPDRCPWLSDRGDAWHLRQMATAAHVRGRGIGGAVLEAAAGYVVGRGGSLLWCNARESAVGFYATHGFCTHGAVFTDERHTIPHRRMWRELSGAPGSST